MNESQIKKASKGVQTLVELFTEIGILFPSEYIDRAIAELKQEGPSGSRALVALIDELVACRSPKISMALKVAKEIQPVPELIEAVRSVASASELTVPPMRYRFTPEIVGAGRVGWTSGTHKEVRELARETLDILEILSEEKKKERP